MFLLPVSVSNSQSWKHLYCSLCRDLTLIRSPLSFNLSTRSLMFSHREKLVTTLWIIRTHLMSCWDLWEVVDAQITKHQNEGQSSSHPFKVFTFKSNFTSRNPAIIFMFLELQPISSRFILSCFVCCWHMFWAEFGRLLLPWSFFYQAPVIEEAEFRQKVQRQCDQMWI